MDNQIFNECKTVNPGYMQFCENCNNDMLTRPEDKEDVEQDGMFGSSYPDEEQAPSKAVDNAMILFAGLISIFVGGILWFIAALVIHFIFRQQQKSWLFFVVPWVLLQVLAAFIFGI